jgi:hypothetical protein
MKSGNTQADGGRSPVDVLEPVQQPAPGPGATRPSSRSPRGLRPVREAGPLRRRCPAGHSDAAGPVILASASCSRASRRPSTWSPPITPARPAVTETEDLLAATAIHRLSPRTKRSGWWRRVPMLYGTRRGHKIQPGRSARPAHTTATAAERCDRRHPGSLPVRREHCANSDHHTASAGHQRPQGPPAGLASTGASGYGCCGPAPTGCVALEDCRQPRV